VKGKKRLSCNFPLNLQREPKSKNRSAPNTSAEFIDWVGQAAG